MSHVIIEEIKFSHFIMQLNIYNCTYIHLFTCMSSLLFVLKKLQMRSYKKFFVMKMGLERRGHRVVGVARGWVNKF